MSLRIFFSILMALVSMAIISCGGGGGGGGNNTPSEESTVTILGSGVKGLLANATVSIYALNISLPLSYDPALPLASGVTDSVGRPASLEVPANLLGPLVLVVDGSSSIDLNSNQVPVITSLTSLFTLQYALAGNPIVATPYTTIAHEMAKSNSTSSASRAAFHDNFSTAVIDVGAALGFGTATSVNFLTTPAVLSEDTSGEEQQYAIVQHRAAIEALAAIVVELRTASGNTLSSAEVIVKLAEDLFNDGQINGNSGLNISVIPENIEDLYVPGTQVQIKDIGEILESDRQYTGVNTPSVRALSPILTALTLSSGNGESIDDNDDGADDNDTAAPAAVISFSTGNINFGRLSMGASTDISITLTNIGNAPLVITNIATAQKQSFTQTNDCNGLVPSGQNCTVNITFSPVGLGNRSDFLSVSGDGVATRTVSLLGVGDNAMSPQNTVLDIDFERLNRGAYRESDLRSDFNVNSWESNGLSEFRRYRFETVHGPNRSSMDIVADPVSSGRGNVLRTLHGNGVASGGFRFRADLPPSNEYYFAYDFYIPSGWFQPLQFKMPALINGTLLEASHGRETPSTETLVAFNSRMQLFSDSGSNRGDGSFCSIVYDKDSVQRPRWTNFITPTSLDFSGQRDNLAGQYIMPHGRWVKIEQYVKVNTNGLNNGKMMMWVDGELIYDHNHNWRDAASTRLWDGIYMYSYYGGNPNDPRNRPPADQYHYYDNFIVSDSPITH